MASLGSAVIIVSSMLIHDQLTGAGQYALVAMAVAFGVFIVTGLRFIERWMPGSDKSDGPAAGD